MVARQVSAPTGHQQIRRGKTYRDTRSFTARVAADLRSPLMAFVLLGLGGASYAVPAINGAALLAAPLLTLWVASRKEALPLHMPRHCGLDDRNDLDPKDRKPRKANGIVYLGVEAKTRLQLWLTSDAARQHAALPGTTGAGKTTAIVSLSANPLAHGSGYILVDAKGDNTVYGDNLALARRFGLDDQVLVLNLLTASGSQDSNTFNPFAMGNADAIREMLVSQLGEKGANDSNSVFRDRAVSLIGTVIPALVWMRDAHDIPINIESIRYCTELRWIGTLAQHKVFLIRNPGSNKPIERAVPDIPDDILWPFQAYLGELPGYDSSLEWNTQKENKPSEQHGYAKQYFSLAFTQLGVSLGHIFRAETPDIIMRDVVLNRRILLVILPSLENSSDTLAGLGKIIVASLRGVMAQLLGAKLHGDASEVFKLKAGSGDAPFQIFFDEMAAYVTDGMDRMLAMGRGLNCMFWLSFQDLPGLTTRVGDKAFSLLGNANLTHALRLQDAVKTRPWLEEQADKIEVTQATHYERHASGDYHLGQGAEVREVSRLPWSDLQSLIEGEAVTLFGGRVIHSKTFFAAVNGRSGAIRRAKPVSLLTQKTLHGADPDAETWAVVENIEHGGFLSQKVPGPVSPLLKQLLENLASNDNRDVNALFYQVASSETALLSLADSPLGTAQASANGAFGPMLDALTTQRPGFLSPPPSPVNPVDGLLIHRLEALESEMGFGTGKPRRRAMMALGIRDTLRAQAASDVGADVPERTVLLGLIQGLRATLEAA